MIKETITKRISSLKIRTKLTILILVVGFFCIFLFQFLWMHKWKSWEFFDTTINRSLHIFPDEDLNFWENLFTEALKYDIPDSEDDTNAIESIKPFFDLADDYTGIYIYGIEDGKYRTGKAPEIMNSEGFRTAFDLGYRITDGTGESFQEIPVAFKNGYATVLIYFYHSSMFLFSYLLLCIALCILLFLAVLLFFINRKMQSVIDLKQNILQMASGDLDTPVPPSGNDELGILAHELDCLRLTLSENFRQEESARQANQDLIAALSHDLRTPLTILNGYLEVLRLKQGSDMQDEYLRRCLQKQKISGK